MHFKDIPIGSTFEFGKGAWMNAPYMWTKVDDISLMPVWSMPGHNYCAWGNSPSNFYPETEMHRWLNDPNGFLSYFSEDEINALISQAIEIVPPKHKRKEFGHKTACVCKVALPAMSQLVLVPDEYHNVPDEGASFRKLFERSVPTRTACGEKSFYQTDRLGGPARVSFEQYVYVRPLIFINPDASFVDGDKGFRVGPELIDIDNDVLYNLLTNW